MNSLLMLASWVGLVAVAFVLISRRRARLRQRLRPPPPVVTDAAIRRILETGTLADDDEPLDMREIQEAEERFLSEPWDEPDEP